MPIETTAEPDEAPEEQVPEPVVMTPDESVAETHALLEAGRPEEAVAMAEAALVLAPEHEGLIEVFAEARIAFEATLTFAQITARSLSPADAAAKARALTEVGGFTDAVELAEAALERAPGDGGLLLALAEAEAAVGLYDKAIEHLDEGLAGNEHRAGLAYLRAKIAHYSDDQALALRLLGEVELIEPFAVSPVTLTARALAALDREDETWELLYDAVKARPNSLTLLFSLARLATTPERFDAFYKLWLKGRAAPSVFAKTVRPLLTACVRAREFGRYRMIARRGIEILLGAKGKIKPNVRDRTLGFGDGERALRDVVLELQKHGVPHFLAAGTCLGAVRAGRLLSFDTDIDIGIFEADFDRDKLTRMFRGNPNFRLHDADPDTPKIGLQHWNGLMVDLFPFVSRDGKVWHSGVFTEWWNTPFETREIELYDLTVSIPAESDLYLTECYGEWRIPNPVFDAFYQGPNAVVIWDEYFEAYLLRRVFEVIATGNLPLAVRYIRRFPRVFSWLNQQRFGLDAVAPAPDPVMEPEPEPEPEPDPDAEPGPDADAAPDGEGLNGPDAEAAPDRDAHKIEEA